MSNAIPCILGISSRDAVNEQSDIAQGVQPEEDSEIVLGEESYTNSDEVPLEQAPEDVLRDFPDESVQINTVNENLPQGKVELLVAKQKRTL